MNRIGFFLKATTVTFLCVSAIAMADTGGDEDKYIAKDKVQHFALSALIAAGAGFVANNHFDASVDDSFVAGFGISFGIGGMKEIADSASPGEHSSWKDLAADFLGALAGAALVATLTK